MGKSTRRIGSLLVAGGVGLLIAPAEASAQDATGFEAGLRVGYGIPLGKATGDAGDDLNRGIAGQIPLWLDVGYRVSPNVFVGLYTHYGIGFVGDDIDMACQQSSQISCSASDVRLGLQLHYHVSPAENVDPWIGPGIGYEWLSLGFEGAGASFSTTASGFEFLNVQGGVDFAPAEHFYLGPFVSFSLDQYFDISVDCSGAIPCMDLASIAGDIPDKSLHEWLVFGVRGGYEP